MTGFEENLDKALRLIDEEGLGLEACLALFSAPEAEKLKPFLETVSAVKERAHCVPPPANQAANKAVFLAELAAVKAAAAPTPWSFNSGAGTLASWLRTKSGRTLAAAVAVVSLTVGVATAAGGTGPKSPLYPVKRAVEAVEAVWPRSDLAQAKLHLNLAETRLAELERAEDSDDPAYERLNAEFNKELAKVKAISARLGYAERREANERYKELELRYKNVSHRRLEDLSSFDESETAKDRAAKPETKKAHDEPDVKKEKKGDGGLESDGDDHLTPKADRHQGASKIEESESNGERPKSEAPAAREGDRDGERRESKKSEPKKKSDDKD